MIQQTPIFLAQIQANAIETLAQRSANTGHPTYNEQLIAEMKKLRAICKKVMNEE